MVVVPAVSGPALACVARFCHASVDAAAACAVGAEAAADLPLLPPMLGCWSARAPSGHNPGSAFARISAAAVAAATAAPRPAAHGYGPVKFADWESEFLCQALKECTFSVIAQARARAPPSPAVATAAR